MAADNIPSPVHTSHLVIARPLLFQEIQITTFKPKSSPTPAREHLPGNPAEVTDSIELSRSLRARRARRIENGEGIVLEDEAMGVVQTSHHGPCLIDSEDFGSKLRLGFVDVCKVAVL